MGNGNGNQNIDQRNSAFENIRRANSNLIPAAARPNEAGENAYPFQGYLQLNDGEDATSQVAVLKMHSAIRRDTIKLNKDSDDKYYFTFKFDSSYDCTVTIYIWCQELRNANNIPLHFVTAPDLPCPNQYKFSKGLDQDFPAKVNVLTPSLYKQQDLTEAKDDYFPLVLMVETDYPSDYKGKAKKSCQITYARFNFENGDYHFQCLKQKFLFNNKMFDLGEIFGIEGGTANLLNDTNKLCVIWFTNDKDTVVLPCRHMCLCMECSQIVRRQSNNCPICRTKVSTFIQIKDDHNMKEVVKEDEPLKQLKKDLKNESHSKAAEDDEEQEESESEVEESKNAPRNEDSSHNMEA